MKPEQERLRNLLYETITMLCKNGLSYTRDLKVQGLLAVTVDDNDVFIVHLNERIKDAVGGFVIPVDCNGVTELSTNVTSKNLPNISSQSFGSDTVQPYDVFNDPTNSATTCDHPENELSQDPQCCSILKVEPMADDCDENTEGMDLVVREIPLARTKSECTEVEDDGNTLTAFTVSSACSSSQNVRSAIDYRVVCDSDSVVREASRKELGSDPKVAVSVISSSRNSVSTDHDQLRAGAVLHNNPNFPNINADPENAPTKLALPKLMRGFLPVVPGFPNRQQVKNDRPLLFISQRQASRLPRRPRESTEKHFVCPFCGLAYYYKKHLKFHLRQKHGL